MNFPEASENEQYICYHLFVNRNVRVCKTVCLFLIQPNYCLIDGICYSNGVNKTGETCSFCDTATNVYDWTLESGYCLIDGTCYSNGTTKSGDNCKLCDVGLATNEWTRDQEDGALYLYNVSLFNYTTSILTCDTLIKAILFACLKFVLQ